MKLRSYQQKLKDDVYAEWASAGNVLAVLPTGGGKTVIFSTVLAESKGVAVAIAHRQELVVQMACSLAACGVEHKILGPQSVIKLAIQEQTRRFGRSFYNPRARVVCAGVDTLLARADKLREWAKSVALWVIDETHHVLRENKWGKAAAMFPNAKGLGVTATPCRADGEGLGAHAAGVFQTMVQGPTMRDLIDWGFLTEYRIFSPPSDLDLSAVKISSTGDFSRPTLVKATKASHIVGDVVQHYMRIAPGKLGVTFAVDVDTATDIAAEFNRAGVAAAVVSAKTPALERSGILRRFANRELMQLVNVDLFGEGFDLPAIEVVSMARPTQSFSLFAQQFGRALRILPGKTHAIIIDHVGNTTRHGLPDAHRVWTLDAREKRGRSTPSDAIPVATCNECFANYVRIKPACPFCGHKPVPARRSAPEFVDGDLTELDAETLRAMRAASVDVEADEKALFNEAFTRHVPPIAQKKFVKNRQKTQNAQRELRESLRAWGDKHRAQGTPDPESYRAFYLKFGVDVLTAQSLKANEANKLNEELKKWI